MLHLFMSLQIVHPRKCSVTLLCITYLKSIFWNGEPITLHDVLDFYCEFLLNLP